MAHQQIQFSETIRAMKLALKRRPDDADSDDYRQAQTNRGNKLQRRARYARQGLLDTDGGVAFHKQAKHAGYTRATISTNPPFFDDEGYPYSASSSDGESERYAQPAYENPFDQVRLEQLLRPLTSPAELPTHPSLSIPFKSTALAQMAGESLETLRRGRASLWKAKRLLQRFRGDVDWVPCAALETPHDEMLLHTHGKLIDPSAAPSSTTEQPPQFTDAASEIPPNADASLPGDDAPGEDRDRQLPLDIPLEESAMEGVETIDMANHPATRNGDVETEATWKPDDPAHPAPAPDADVAASEAPERETASETASVSNGTNVHAMTTRARARSPVARTEEPPSPSPSDSASAIPLVHPWFLPSTALPDRDLGLPAREAEETRKFLLLYVQKQEQIVRALASLHSGLQKADRLRHFVYQSCKAEAHLVPDAKGNLVTEMSDGEDWYDVADWDLQSWELKDGKLEKGKDEVEDVEEEGRRGPRRGRRVNRM